VRGQVGAIEEELQSFRNSMSARLSVGDNHFDISTVKPGMEVTTKEWKTA
jgi:hypothetical protein